MHKPKPRPGKTPGQCETCSTSFIGRSDQRFCKPCRADRERAQNRIAARAKYRSKGGRQLGMMISCSECAALIPLRQGRSKMCAACRKPYQARWRREQRRNDPMAALTDRIRRGINGSIQKGAKRRRGWEALVGYTLQDLATHLERQFTKGMSWENRAKWHIDHIRPLSSFSFTSPDDPGFREAWALTNLRPLWKPENEKKQAKRIFLI